MSEETKIKGIIDLKDVHGDLDDYIDNLEGKGVIQQMTDKNIKYEIMDEKTAKSINNFLTEGMSEKMAIEFNEALKNNIKEWILK